MIIERVVGVGVATVGAESRCAARRVGVCASLRCGQSGGRLREPSARYGQPEKRSGYVNKLRIVRERERHTREV